MLLASGVIAALAVSIIGIKIPSKQEFRKLRTARATLAASFITLSILNFICYFTGYDEDLDRLNTMIVAAFQALLLTGTLLVFIRPDVVTGKWVGLQVAAISLITALLYFVMFLFSGDISCLLLHRSGSSGTATCPVHHQLLQVAEHDTE